MTTPTTDQVKAAYKAGAEHLNERGTYVTQPQMERDFDSWLHKILEDAKPPCVGCTYGDGPQEDCPRHGREYAYWVEGCEMLAARIEKVRAVEETLGDLLAHGAFLHSDGVGIRKALREALDMEERS